MRTPAQPPTAPTACITDLVVVVPASELSAAVDGVLCGTRITALGPSGDLESECLAVATRNRPLGEYRPVFIVASTATILSIGPLVAALRSGLATNHVPIALADPDSDIDILWGHIFDAGLITNPPGPDTGEPPLVATVSKATHSRTTVAPLRIVRMGQAALAEWLAIDAASDHSLTLIDGTERDDLTTIARTIPHRPLTIGTPTLLRELLRIHTVTN